MSAVSEILVTLVADTKEYTTKLDEAMAKTEELGASQKSLGSKIGSAWGKISSAVLGAGIAFAGLSLEKAYAFQESMDLLQRTAGLTGAQIKYLSAQIQNISMNTGQSTSALASAATLIEQAGIRGSAAINLLNDASMAAVATNTSLTTVTQALIAAQSLQIAKGMSIGNLTGILVAGSHDFIGGLSAEVSMLQGRVGVALAQYGVSLKNTIALGAEFAKAGLPTRSLVSFATALGNLSKPMITASGNVSNYATVLQTVGLSFQQLSNDAQTGNIVGILQAVDQAAKSGQGSLQQLTTDVFGSGGAPTASYLIKNLKELPTLIGNMKGAGASSLGSSFHQAMKQLGPQLSVLREKLSNLMVTAGDYLLPNLQKVATWANGLFAYFKKHPLVGKIASDAVIGLFAVSLATKVWGVIKGVFGSIGSVAHNAEEAANTLAIRALTAVMIRTTEVKAASSVGTDATLLGAGAGGGLLGAGAGGGLLGGIAADGALAAAVGTASIIPGIVTGIGSYMATSWALHNTPLGKVATSGGELNPLNDLTNVIAGATGKMASPTVKLAGAGAQFADWLQKSLGLSPMAFSNLSASKRSGVEARYRVHITAKVR